MKKICALMLVLMLIMPCLSVLPAGAIELNANGDYLTNPNDKIVVNSAKEIYPWNRNKYIGFSDVDMTGIKSITASVRCMLPGSSNGDTIAIMLDSPYGTESSVNCVGYIVLNRESPNGGAEYADYTANIKESSGTHDIYFVSCLGSNNSNYIRVKSFTLNTETVTKEDETVSDSYTYSVKPTTWALTDELGRKAADYAEAGPVKEGKHDVGILYWNWFVSPDYSRAYIPGEVINKYPLEKDNYLSPVWDNMGDYWWGEPLFGFYDSYDYWVYRRHAEMLANSGVDFIAFDYSNGGLGFVKPLTILVKAFRDAKKDGIVAPKITAMTDLGAREENSVRLLQSMYFNCFVGEDYTDVWYYLDGKPLLFGNSLPEVTAKVQSVTYDDGTTDTFYRQIADMATIEEFFTYRNSGSRTGPFKKVDDRWIWLEDFPIHGWNWQEDTGRYEFCSVGTGINESYIYKLAATGVFSDEYTKGRGYSEAFGEDRTGDGMYMAYYFRDQSSMALEMEPEIIMIDGWNEWTAVRNGVYNGFTNSFVDTFDDDNSRDFEPSAGALRDHYYCLMIDFIRKYKGVEKEPVAGAALTVNEFSDWEGVAYEYLNYPSVARSDEGYLIAPAKPEDETPGRHSFEYAVYNSIVKAKVSYDNDNFYFLAETKEDVTLDTPFAMQLYIDADRNKATGWNGYDYALNVEQGKIAKNINNTYSWENISDVEMADSGTKLMVTVPRDTIKETAEIDFEFKWTDAIDLEEEFLNVYKGGSSAPFGRYNYVYSNNQLVYPGEEINADLSNNSVVRAGVNKMTVGASMITVYEPDTRVTPVLIDGTIYVPEDALHEIIGYGKSKSWYDAPSNTFRLMRYELEPYEVDGNDGSKITKHNVNYTWLYTEVNSDIMTLEGNKQALSNPVKVIDGIFFVPLSLLSDAYGYTVSVNDGVAVVTAPGATAISAATVDAVTELF
ncbi:MAG: hypothetical protein IJD97_09965 [Clostridia bacterium]|nr:hypothetical protein [Clostridia bacterium]